MASALLEACNPLFRRTGFARPQLPSFWIGHNDHTYLLTCMVGILVYKLFIIVAGYTYCIPMSQSHPWVCTQHRCMQMFTDWQTITLVYYSGLEWRRGGVHPGTIDYSRVIQRKKAQLGMDLLNIAGWEKLDIWKFTLRRKKAQILS